MSVAFRRESDEEHLEPKFELPIPPGPNIVTPRGLALIRARIVELETSLASAVDDRSREGIKRDLRYWNTRLATARIADPPAADVAGIGSRVTFSLNGKVRTIDVVGHDESEPAAGRIAFSAPLARVLVGMGAGELVDFASVTEAIELLKIERTPA